jgi:hypothetical protein
MWKTDVKGVVSDCALLNDGVADHAPNSAARPQAGFRRAVPINFGKRRKAIGLASESVIDTRRNQRPPRSRIAEPPHVISDCFGLCWVRSVTLHTHDLRWPFAFH